MSYDARERARYSGQPVECFMFVRGASSWLYTSADADVILPAGTFVMETIEREQHEFSGEETSETVPVSIPITNAVAQALLASTQAEAMWLTIFRAHRGDESEAICVFTGKVMNAELRGSTAKITCASIGSMMRRTIPILGMQTPCNHTLYGAGCGVDQASCVDEILVGAVVGVLVTSADFAERDDEWFRGGKLVNAEGIKRFIADHQGDTVTLLSAMPGLAAQDVVSAYWGCDHTETACGQKFGNLVNHLGWSHLPGDNPFIRRVD